MLRRMSQELVRISKLMTERGLCSRREADELIEQGLVLVDGLIVSTLGSKTRPQADIRLLPAATQALGQQMTILMNKPIGYVSGQPEGDYPPAVRLVTPDRQFRLHNERRLAPKDLLGLAPAGRLDIDSQGLLVLTQNGRIAKQLIGEGSNIEKEYLVRVRGHLSSQGLQLLNHGLSLDGEELKPASVTWQNEDQLKFILREGKKRQIRRMCELVGLEVAGLKRVRIGRLRLGQLPEGRWRFLLADERF